MSAEEAPPPARLGTLSRAGRVIVVHVRLHPAIFWIAVSGAAVFALATVASSWVLKWVTDNVILPRFNDGHVTAGMVVPGPTAISPLAGCMRPAARRNNDVLPPPVAPTTAIVAPLGTLKVTSCKTSRPGS